MCCVLTVREELIRENRPLVQNLVNYVLGAGVWLDEQPENREQGGHDRRRPRVFQPGPEHPPLRDGQSDRPRDLWRPAHGPREFDELMQLSVEAGTLKHPVPYAKYVDESFAKAAHAAVIAL